MRSPALIAVAAGCTLALFQGCESRQSENAGSHARDDARAQVEPSGSSEARSIADFAPLVRKHGDAVVNVNAVGAMQKPPAAAASPSSDPFFDFFRRFGMPDMPQRAPVRAQGSGFIVSSDGYVLTNAHVIDGADEVTVKLTDRRELATKIVGLDRRTDVAVLKIEGAGELPAVRIGDPAKLAPGEWVLAIGSPFGFENSVTAGVVSATARVLGAESSVVPFIQTDVAVNPGNSGGPLFNLRGEVVGINSQIYSATGGYQGLSFAIPINVARDVERQLRQYGRVARGYIGVSIQDVDARLARAFQLDRPRGALINAVAEGSPAEATGLLPGDVILAVNGQPLETSTELPAIVASMEPGSEAVFEVWRRKRVQRIHLRLGELSDPIPPTSQPGPAASSPDKARLGLRVRPLTSEEKKQVNSNAGLIVESVSGPAAAAGVQPGDIVLAVGESPVRSGQELRSAVEAAGDSVALLIERQEARIYIPIQRG